MTPNDIEILIHFNCTSAPHPRGDAPAVRQSINTMLIDNLLEVTSDSQITLTSRGQAHLRQLCRLDYPTQIWVDAQGKPI